MKEPTMPRRIVWRTPMGSRPGTNKRARNPAMSPMIKRKRMKPITSRVSCVVLTPLSAQSSYPADGTLKLGRVSPASSQFEHERGPLGSDVRGGDDQGVGASNRRRDRETHADVVLRLIGREGIDERRQGRRPDRGFIWESQRGVTEAHGALARVHRRPN